MSFSYNSYKRTTGWDNQNVPQSVAMEFTYSSGSNSTTNSQLSYETNCTTPPSDFAMGSYDNSSTYNSNYYDSRHNSNAFNSMTSTAPESTYYHPEQSQSSQPTNARPTPTSLGWEGGNWAIKDYYDLELPQKEAKSKPEPRLVLLPEFPESAYTPRIVYLDRESNPRKGHHPCQFPGKSCWEKKGGTRPVFNRSADLDRHYKHIHARKKEQIPCDYANCSRANDCFGRKDHYRDHLRDYHKEDMDRPMVSTGKKPIDKDTWRKERKIHAKWWRCTKCLIRIHIRQSGWKCTGCKSDCEPERKMARLGGIEEKYEDEEMGGVQSYTSCANCKGKGYTDSGKGSWDECLYCAPVPAYKNEYVERAPERGYAGYESARDSDWQY